MKKRLESNSNITKILNGKVAKSIRWCTPSIDPQIEKVLNHYASDVSVSFQSLGIPSTPSGIFKEAYDKAARAYGSDHTLFSVNGSTGSNFIVLRALSKQIPFLKVLTMRNIHKSVVYACEDYGINLMFLPPNIDQELQLFLPNTIDEIVEGIEKNLPDVLLITNPTYDGITIDLKNLISNIRKWFPNLIIFVEEAWGSHLHFSDKLPISAMKAGADICIQSTHKQGGALQQGGMIHWIEGRINSEMLIDSYKSISTSSPSFLILASLDAARVMMEKNGNKKINNLLSIAKKLSDGIARIPGLKVVTTSQLKERNSSVFDRDETKIIVDVLQTGLTGYKIAQILEEKFNIIVERYDARMLLFLTPFQTTFKDVKSTLRALSNIVENNHIDFRSYDRLILEIPRKIIKRREINEISRLRLDQVEKVPLEKAYGRISAEDITIYPPGIPITIKGEEFTKEIIAYYSSQKQYPNSHILAQDTSLETVLVVK
jgi:arginine decarboxylase